MNIDVLWYYGGAVMVLCPRCRKVNSDGALFCEFCGEKQLTNVSPERPGNSITKFVPAKCCNCGANIEVNKEQDAAICTACGTPFIVEKAINLYISSQGAGVSDFDIVGGVLRKYKGASVDVSIPEGVIEIKPEAFSDCQYLNSVVFPSSLRKLPEKAFLDFEKLTSITFNQLECISESAFEGCIKLNAVKLPDNLKTIGKNAFENCRSLKSIILPTYLEMIDVGAFSYCTAIESISIPNNLKRLKAQVFKGCKSLKKVVMPDGFAILRDELFSGCTSLIDINVPSKLKEIGNRTFTECTSIKSFKFPSTLEKIGIDAFNECSSLEEISFSSELKDIPSGVFKKCSSLKRVELPKALESIGSNAFDGCSALYDIIFPNSLKTIEDHAFANCTSLKDIHLPDNINLEAYVFAQCPSARIFLPRNCDQITRLMIAAEKSKIVLRNIDLNPIILYFIARQKQKLNIGGTEYTMVNDYDTVRERSANMAREAKRHNECCELCDFFHPSCKIYTMAYFKENYQFIFVGSSYQKDYKEYRGYEYGDVSLYDFVVLDNFLTDYVGYTQDKNGFDKESNYEKFSSDLENDRIKLTKLFEYAGIKNYKIETVEAPIIKKVDGVFSSKFVSRGKRNFLRIQIPFTV